MAGEVIVDAGSWVDLTTSGGAISNAAYGEAATTFSRVSNGGGRPWVEIEFEFANSSNASGSPLVALYTQARDLFGAADHAVVPSGTNPARWEWSEQTATGITTAQRKTLILRDVPEAFRVYLYNQTGHTIAAGWKMRARGYSLTTA